MVMRRKTNQDGQAMTELMVCIIGILIVFTGFLMIVDLGVGKVENVIQARGDAERNSYLGVFTSSGYPIRTWGVGQDSIYFSEDDQRVGPTAENISKFSGELGNPIFSLSTDFALPYVENNFASSLGSGILFLPAARLTGAEASRSIQLDGATRALYFDTPSISLSDVLYMPVID